MAHQRQQCKVIKRNHNNFRRFSRQWAVLTTNTTMHSHEERFSRLSDFILCRVMHRLRHCPSYNRILICVRIIGFPLSQPICIESTVFGASLLSLSLSLSLSWNKSICSELRCPFFSLNFRIIRLCVHVSHKRSLTIILFLGTDCVHGCSMFCTVSECVYVIKSTCSVVVLPLEPECSVFNVHCSRIPTDVRHFANTLSSSSSSLRSYYYYYFIFNFASSPPHVLFFRYSILVPPSRRRHTETQRNGGVEGKAKKKSTRNLNEHARK